MAKKSSGERLRSIPELRAEMQSIAGARLSSGRLQENYTKNYFSPDAGRSKPTGYTDEQFFSAQARYDAERSGILGHNSDARFNSDLGSRVDPFAGMRGRSSRQEMQTRVDLWQEMEKEDHLRAYGDDASLRMSDVQFGPGYASSGIDPHQDHENLSDWGISSKRAPAPITVAPTSTINPKRPRTVAAGYVVRGDDPAGTLTVVFRDGTYYNYYSVPEEVWNGFKSSPSKGRFIATNLDQYPRGEADLAAMDLKVRSLITIYQAARLAQKHAYRKGTQAHLTAEVESGRRRGAAPKNYKPSVPKSNTRRTSDHYLGRKK